MVNAEDKPKTTQNHEEKITRVVNQFKCTSCGRAGEHFFSLADRSGSCVGCGHGLELDASYYEPAMKELHKSVLLISESDMEAKSSEIQDLLQNKGFVVINTRNILEGNRLESAPENLSFLISNAAMTLVIPSPELQRNSHVNASIASVIRDNDDFTSLMPIYTDTTSYSHQLRAMHDDWVGFDWGQIDAGQDRSGVTRNNFFNILTEAIQNSDSRFAE